MALIEHIITSCTQVAEAHALLAILEKAGTVPWKTLAPYMKVLREWHHECGRRPVLSNDLRIPVCDAVMYGRYQFANRRDEIADVRNENNTHRHEIAHLRDEICNARNESNTYRHTML